MKGLLRKFFFLSLPLLGLLPPREAAAQCTPPVVLSTTDSNRCGPGTVDLEATASGGTLNWYGAATGGAVLGTGSPFTTPAITATTTYYVAAATGGGTTNDTIATITGGTNGCGGGVMFNITPTVNITVDSFLNLSNSTQTVTVTVYYKTGTYVGSELTAGDWTSAGTTSVSTTSGQMVKLYAGAGIPMTAGVTYGIFLAGMSNAYTNGNGTNQTYTNADLTLSCGAGLCGVFTSTVNTPRVFNGAVYYHKGGGCESARQPVVATVKPMPTVTLMNDTTICPGITYTLNAGNPGATYAWNTGASSQSINVSAAGMYSVLVTGSNGCSNSDAVTVTAGVVPVNNLPATTDLCEGETVSLNAGNTGSAFLWTPGGATSQFINVTSAGTYSAKITSTDGCEINSSTNVILRPLPVPNLGNDTSICDGDQIPLDAGNPGYTYLWSTGATSQSISASDSGTYSVTVTTPYNCVNTEEQHIAYLPSPRVEGFNFIPLFYEDLGKVQFSPLNPTYVNSYEWDFGDGSNTSTQVSPMHTYASGGDYLVTLKVFNGCGDFDISLPINVDIVTGIVTLGKEVADVTIYPNPARGYITIANKSNNIAMEKVMIFNTLGAVVYDQVAEAGRQHRVTVSQLAAGIYTARILTDKGWVIRRFEVLP